MENIKMDVREVGHEDDKINFRILLKSTEY
jgi:hypothetical protein